MYPATIRIMKATASGAADCQWKWLAESAAEKHTTHCRARRRGKAHSSELATLVLVSERARFAAGFPRVLTLSQFCEQIHTVLIARSLMGSCRR